MQNQKNNSRRYYIKPITIDHANQVFTLFKQQYALYQPLMEAYNYELTPQERKVEIQNMWDERTNTEIRELIGKNLSIGCFDQQNNDEIVGAILINDGLTKDTSDIANFLKQELFKTVPAKHLSIIQSSSFPFVEHWLFCIKTSHSGKGLLKQMVSLANQLAGQKNYLYSVCWASNFKSAKTMKGEGYQLIGQTDAKQFLFGGVHPFKNLRQQHQMQTLWLKRISEQVNPSTNIGELG